TNESPETVNESELLVKFLEGSDGGFLNTSAPALINAFDVKTNITTGKEQYVIDIRSEDDFNIGHIKDAVNVKIKDIVSHYEANNLSSKELVVITCYSGQGAGYATTLLRLLGYSNVKDLMWGMCSWNNTTSSYWTSSINNSRSSQFETTNYPKAIASDLPLINTSKSNGEEILRIRIEEMLATADPLGDVKIKSDEVYSNLDNYYIINYWSETDYNWGHIKGAMQYTPKTSLLLETDLTTLPTDKKIVVYCYTGHTSAPIATYLRVLGYDAETIVFGVNGMSYDNMPGTKFNADTEIYDYELVQ
ncbi:MAG: rhodanese-like domain-containing protein, partial [Melioribacteraceae bacterium]|nr:rhodanese-like domain-containing protein [Melioribacteraceae bacterium]